MRTGIWATVGRVFLAGWAAMAVLGLDSPALAEQREVYSAVAVGTGGGIGARSLGLTMRINEYTSDEKIRELAVILAEGGQNRLQREMESLEVGSVSPTGRIGNQIAVARKRPVENGYRIILVTARRMSFLELRSGGRSRDYPFSILRFEVDEEGKGQGEVIIAAKVSFDDEGRLEVESLGRQIIRLGQVRRLD